MSNQTPNEPIIKKVTRKEKQLFDIIIDILDYPEKYPNVKLSEVVKYGKIESRITQVTIKFYP